MTSKDIAVTNFTEKLLHFIKNHENVTFSDLKSKFSKLDYMDLVLLCLSGYLLCTKPGKIPTDFRDGNFTVSPNDRFWASPKATQLIEERFQRRWQWIVPTIISALALILSAIALIVSITQGPEAVYITNWPQYQG